jgi:pimeloyl-ACP methyl ester carboxylesterase
MGNAAGDPRYAALEARLAALPKISVPTIVIHGAVDDVNPQQISEGHQRFLPVLRTATVRQRWPQPTPRGSKGLCPSDPGSLQASMMHP